MFIITNPFAEFFMQSNAQWMIDTMEMEVKRVCDWVWNSQPWMQGSEHPKPTGGGMLALALRKILDWDPSEHREWFMRDEQLMLHFQKRAWHMLLDPHPESQRRAAANQQEADYYRRKVVISLCVKWSKRQQLGSRGKKMPPRQ